MSKARIKALVIAEAANPDWVSVPLVGWSHAQALAERADVHLVTQVRNRDAIANQGWQEGAEFTVIDSEAVARALWRVGSVLRGGADRGWTTLAAVQTPSYYYFEHLLWQQFGARIRAGEWDVVHRLTPLSPALPSLIARRVKNAGVPFVVGPLNGGVPWPRAYDALRRREGEWLSYVREVYRLLPGYRQTRKCASAIVVGSRITLDQVPQRLRDRCVYLPENAIDPSKFEDRAPAAGQRASDNVLRIAFVGRLVPLKCVDVLLEAAASLIRERPHSKQGFSGLEIEIIGDGPERAPLEALAKSLGISELVRFAGWVEHGKLAERLGRSHVFAFPSIREFGGGAVLEAMTLGLVPVVVDYGGPAELVTDTTGVRIPIGPKKQLIEGFRAALRRLMERPQEVAALGARAQTRVREVFTWDAKARQMVEIYRWVLGRRERPDFGMPLHDSTTADSTNGQVGPSASTNARTTSR